MSVAFSLTLFYGVRAHRQNEGTHSASFSAVKTLQLRVSYLLSNMNRHALLQQTEFSLLKKTTRGTNLILTLTVSLFSFQSSFLNWLALPFFCDSLID